MVYVPRSEAVNRISERNKLKDRGIVDYKNKQNGGSKIDWWTPCQRCSQGPFGQADVVFCTCWDEDFTKSQVERAWNHFVRSTIMMEIKVL